MMISLKSRIFNKDILNILIQEISRKYKNEYYKILLKIFFLIIKVMFYVMK